MKIYIGKRGASIVQYAMIVVLVAGAFTVMNTYVKRAYQSRLKDMSDYFISGGQEVQEEDSDPQYSTRTSQASTGAQTIMSKQSLLGGGIRSGVSDSSDTSYTSISEDRRKPLNPNKESEGFISAEDIDVEVPQRPDEPGDDSLEVLKEQVLADKADAESDLAACNGDANCIAVAQRRIKEADEVLANLGGR